MGLRLLTAEVSPRTLRDHQAAARILPQSLRDSSLPEGAGKGVKS